jgi:hypothetical protein
MLEPPALKREIVIDNFAGGWGIQVLKEGLEHAVDCAITHDPTRTPSTYPTSNSDDRHAKRARPTKEGRARFHALRAPPGRADPFEHFPCVGDRLEGRLRVSTRAPLPE